MENINEVQITISIIVGVLNSLGILYLSFRKLKPEVKKLELEGDSEIVDAAHVNLEGAVLSSSMLKERIDELKKDLEAEKKSRRDDIEYFRRRIKDIEKEARDYRLWAARLAKQVIESGKVPVPFITSLNDTDPLITAITREQEQLELAKGNRKQELKEQKQAEEEMDKRTKKEK